MRVDLDNVAITFPVYTGKAKSLRSTLLYLGSAGALERDASGVVTINALRNISFSARTGDRIALVGRNGAGKTTLLKTIAGIYSPSRGSVHVEGKVSPLFGAGLGVDEELTGHEAIEFACLLRGIAPGRIPELAADIAEFTELNEYLSLPVRTYSAGMKMRLGFAVATAEAPEILLIDETIMAGDLHFFERARERTDRLFERASVLFLAAHAEGVLRENCNKALLLDSGEILAAGDVAEVFELYNALETPPRKIPRMTAAVAKDDGAERTGEPIESGGAAGHPVLHALDGAVRTRWMSASGGAAHEAFVGYDFGAGHYVEVRQVALRQRCAELDGHGVGPMLVQLSNDRFAKDVRTAARIEPKPGVGRQQFVVPHSAPARYWRLLPAGAPGPWGLIEFDFDSRGPEEGLQGRPISSPPSAANVPAASAFDANPDTHWCANERAELIAGRAWLGWDFGPGRKLEARSFVLRQWDGGGRPNTIPRVKVQSSNDRFYDDLHTADTVELACDEERHQYRVAPSRAARFWRILADSTTGGGRWGVIELEFSQRELDL